jgi:Raf kinase inhibitor-like YbhB/YbcL family protein
MSFSLEIKAFGDGKPIPRRHTCDGEDVSPELSWSGAPPGTRGFALIVDDPDAPVGVWNHWLLYDIPASISSLDGTTSPGEAMAVLALPPGTGRIATSSISTR